MGRPEVKINPECGKRLKELMQELKERFGITQAKMAKDIYLSQQTISGIVNGSANMTIANAQKIAEYANKLLLRKDCPAGMADDDCIQWEWLAGISDDKELNADYFRLLDTEEKFSTFTEEAFKYAIAKLGYTMKRHPRTPEEHIPAVFKVNSGQLSNYYDIYAKVKETGEDFVLSTISYFDYFDICSYIESAVIAIVDNGIMIGEDNRYRMELEEIYRRHPELKEEIENG